jgi:head-tail adaptor
VQFRAKTLTSDGFGSAEVWADEGDPQPAKKEDVSDGERWRAGETQAHVTARFRVRQNAFTDAITPAWRLACQGLEYDIVGKREPKDTRGRWWEFLAAARNDSHV